MDDRDYRNGIGQQKQTLSEVSAYIDYFWTNSRVSSALFVGITLRIPTGD